jgi:hypothetical protein
MVGAYARKLGEQQVITQTNTQYSGLFQRNALMVMLPEQMF